MIIIITIIIKELSSSFSYSSSKKEPHTKNSSYAVGLAYYLEVTVDPFILSVDRSFL